MSEGQSEEHDNRSYPADRLFNILAREPYQSLSVVWEKAVDRVDLDPSGAITAVKSLLEATCKMVLERTGNQVPNNADLPGLYSLASRSLEVAPSQQSEQSYRSILGAVHTIIQSVGELRNQRGDAHGSHKAKFSTSISEAELAVNLAGSIVLFLLLTLESYLVFTRRIGSDGRIVLVFEKSAVWRLIDHSRNSSDHLEFYGQDTGPAIWLVGDSGIYLMSNGQPRLGEDGLLIEPGKELEVYSLRVHADGCDPRMDDFERWWIVHGAIDEGSDFCIPIPAENMLSALQEATTKIVIVVGEEDYSVYPDNEFERVFGENSLL